MDKKRKGGAERLRDQKRKIREKEAEKYTKLSTLFKKENVQEAGASTSLTNKGEMSLVEEILRPGDFFEMRAEDTLKESEHNSQCIIQDSAVENVDKSTPTQPEEEKLVPSPEQSTPQDVNLFKQPRHQEISYFFKIHPKQPTDDSKLPFNSRKVFYREDGINRSWLTYDNLSVKLHCTVCLAFTKPNEKEKSTFIQGLNDWKHTYQRIKEHENSKMHVACSESYLHFSKDKDIGTMIFSNQKQVRKEQVKKKRQVLERVIDVVKLIGKRGLSFRSKRAEAAYTLEDSSLDHGNFLEIMILLGKYDIVLKEHLGNIVKKSKIAYDLGSKGRGNLLTFMSKTTVNLVIQSISSTMKCVISNEIKSAGMFSVQIDTTQDISVQDQCSVIIRYLKEGNIEEKLLAVVTCNESTGKSFMELVQKVLVSNNLNIQNCIGNSTDGAANMNGQYNGFTAWLSSVCPGQIHIWCYSHVLNLVLGDATKSPIAAASFFTLLNSLAAFFKESYQRMNIWSDVSDKKNPRHKRLQSIGETRWWAKHTALNRVFGSYGACETGLYVNIIIALLTIENKESISPEVRVKAKNLRVTLLKYETILVAHIYLRIFNLTTPLSKYLQTSGLDLLKCHQMVNATLTQLRNVQRDVEGVINSSKQFIQWANGEFNQFEIAEEIELEDSFPNKRLKRVKKMADELANDHPINNPLKKFTIEVHNIILDALVESMVKRFENNGKLYMDLSFLSPQNFIGITSLPTDALQSLSDKLIKFDERATKENLRNELINFASSWDRLKVSITDEYHYFPTTNEEYQGYENSESEDEDTLITQSPTPCKSCQNCSICCYKVLIKYNLFSVAYSVLTLAYKYLLTLPTTQVACERSFSTLKFVKNRLRSTLSENNLEAFMLMAVEKQTLNGIDSDALIDKVAENSNLLKNELMF